jgi:ubiquinone/menaquinone biosynthesis C-methylase UbiE
MKPTQLTGILGRRRLQFRDNRELEQYYEDKYRQGGYEGGCIRFGINISELCHRERHRSALSGLNPAPHETILDAGCGDGRLAALVAGRCRVVHAIDIAGNALDPRFAALPNLHFAKMNVESLTFAGAAFDQIVAVETLEHVLQPDRAIAEFHRVLKRGGRLVVTYPTINRTLVQRLQRSLRLGRPMQISEHLTEWSYDELVRHVETAGFELVGSQGLVFDFGVLGAIKSLSKSLAMGMTALALRIRSFPRNSTFVSLVFRRP